MDGRNASRATFALAAALAALCGMLASGYASAAPHIRILGMARPGGGPAPTDEFCRKVGISVGNQRILLHRGRTRLREVVEAEMEKG